MRAIDLVRGRGTGRVLLGAVICGLLALLLPVPPVAGQQGESPAPTEPPVPESPRGLNLELPSQEAFRDWPPRELIERPYWSPWNRMSFQRGALFNRPVFFVLTVPWNRQAQRMQSETLSDPGVLEILNRGWTCILVNADRRPDIRERYQTGTWPVVAFLLPDGRPMISQANPQGVAMPITASLVNVETMLFLLGEGQLYYDRWSNVLDGVGEQWTLREGGNESVAGEVRAEASDLVARWLLGNADRQEGGFGAAPKYVLPGLAGYAALRDARLLPALTESARLTLEKIVTSPLYDPREGGVHRIAAAPGWKRIHYEKMLDKNAHLLNELVVNLRTGGDSTVLREAMAGTARFLTSVLARSGGGFHLAQFADSSSNNGGAYWTAPDGERGSPPPVSRTVLAGPNAVAGAALIRSGVMLGDDSLVEAGRAALELVLSRSYERGRGVDHIIEPRPDDRRYLETQADVAFALLDAYESTGEPRYLSAGRDVVDFALSNLLLPDETALRDHIRDATPLGILGNPRYPMKPNVLLARAMVRLSIHGAGEGYRERATSVVGSFAGDLTVYGLHAIEAALAVEEMIREPLTVRIEGERVGAGPGELRRAALGLPWGWTVVQSAPAGPEEGTPTAEIHWGDSTVRVTGPEQLQAEVRRLTGLEPE